MEDTLKFTIEGMTCGGCVRRVRTALEAVPGVTVERLAVGEEAEVRIDLRQTSAGAVDTAVRGAGYRPVYEQVA
jgi:copper chaperone